MHIILWEFRVREERVQDFISAYGSDVDWAKLFQLAQGFLGTELLRSSDEPNVFLTVDRWESAASFEIFQAQFGVEYAKLDAACEGYALSERKVGIFSGV